MSDIQHKFITNAKKQENMIHNEEKSIKTEEDTNQLYSIYWQQQ